MEKTFYTHHTPLCIEPSNSLRLLDNAPSMVPFSMLNYMFGSTPTFSRTSVEMHSCRNAFVFLYDSFSVLRHIFNSS